MATYAELHDLRVNLTPANAALRSKVATAVTKKAQTILDLAVPTANELNWAQSALATPEAMAGLLFPYVLAANSAATVASIQGATDAAIQTNVNAAADKFIAGGLV